MWRKLDSGAFSSRGSHTTELITGALALHRAPQPRAGPVTLTCTVSLALPLRAQETPSVLGRMALPVIRSGNSSTVTLYWLN